MLRITWVSRHDMFGCAKLFDMSENDLFVKAAKVKSPWKIIVALDNDGDVQAACAFIQQKREYRCMQLVVAEDFRRKGIGSKLLNTLLDYRNERRPYFAIGVDEYCLSGQLFLKRNGLQAVNHGKTINGKIIFMSCLECEGVGHSSRITDRAKI